jgi:hypothetical protein
MRVKAAPEERTATTVNDPEGAKRNIVEVATREFAQKGYAAVRGPTPSPAARAPASA